MRNIISARAPRDSVAPPRQFGTAMRCDPSMLAIYLALAYQCEADLENVGRLQIEHTEPGDSHTYECRDTEWCTRGIREWESQPTQMKRDANTVVKIEAPTASSIAAVSTGAGAGNRRPTETPLAKRFALCARPNDSDIIYDDGRQLIPAQTKYDPTIMGSKTRITKLMPPNPAAT